MNILVAAIEPDFVKTIPSAIPLGPVYIATALKKEHPNVKGISIVPLEYYNDSAIKQRLEQVLKDNQIDIFCIGGSSIDYNFVREIVAFVKSKDILVIIGGGLVTAEPEFVLSNIDADFGIVGEGEISVCQLVNCIEKKTSYTEISGLVFKENGSGHIQVNTSRNIENLDTLPFPDFSLFEEFEKAIMNTKEYPILLSRSCPFKCTFCFHTSGSTYRKRGLDHIFDELDIAIEKYGINRLYLSDELFIDNKKRVEQLCARLKPYNLTFAGQTRAAVVTKEILLMLKSVGCTHIAVGIESADNEILKSMEKHTTIEEIEHALELALEVGLITGGTIIIGDKNETYETATASLNWFHKNNTRYNLYMHSIAILPGSELFQYALQTGIIKDKKKHLEGNKVSDFAINITKMSDAEYKKVKRRIQQLTDYHNCMIDTVEVIAYDSATDMFTLAVEDNKFNETYVVQTQETSFANTHLYRKIGIGSSVDLSKTIQHGRYKQIASIFLDRKFEEYENYKIALWGNTLQCCALLYSSKALRKTVTRVFDFKYEEHSHINILGKMQAENPMILPTIVEDIDYILVASPNQTDSIKSIMKSKLKIDIPILEL